MIWRSTTQIGCAETLCDPLKTTTGNWKGKFWTCEYLAAGNVFPATYFVSSLRFRCSGVADGSVSQTENVH